MLVSFPRDHNMGLGNGPLLLASVKNCWECGDICTICAFSPRCLAGRALRRRALTLVHARAPAAALTLQPRLATAQMAQPGA